MSEPVVPPPSGEKKGLSTGAKIAIGCLVGLLLVAGGCFIVTAFFVKKGVDAVQGFAEDVENDPDAAAVKATELMLRLNPEVEVISSDPKAGKLTLREKKTGKVVTFNAEDLREGKFSFEADGQKVRIDADESAPGDPGSLSITTDEGKVVYGGDEAGVPAWVPRYPAGRAEAFSTIESGGERSGTFTIRTPDAAAAVLERFETTLREAGFEVSKSTLESTAAVGGNLTASRGSRTVNVTVATQEGDTQVLVAYSERP